MPAVPSSGADAETGGAQHALVTFLLLCVKTPEPRQRISTSTELGLEFPSVSWESEGRNSESSHLSVSSRQRENTPETEQVLCLILKAHLLQRGHT